MTSSPGPRLERIAPRADVLVESLRDIGYSMRTAVADIVDNSITAGARNVDLRIDTSDGTAAVAVIDDGVGMTEGELREALRPGSRSPKEKRAASDLGRFGLGMKTASFSQCRRMTVVTRRDGRTCAASWDLDVIAEHGDWMTEWAADIDAIRWAPLVPDHGTMILWEKIDRPSAQDQGATFTRLAHETAEHLGLVFHRFLMPDDRGPPLTIRLNGRPVEASDPFAERHPATIRAPEETIRAVGGVVVIQAFTIPHSSKATPSEWKRMGGDLGHLRSQGFYLYRSGRLISHATWFGLAKHTELTQLARVRIDITNQMDEDWRIDVRKSSAQPPPAVRRRLRDIIDDIRGRSKRVYTRRGARLTDDNPLPVWSRITSGGAVRYALNPDHPVIREFRGSLEAESRRAFDLVLAATAAVLPVEALHADLCGGVEPGSVGGADMSDEDLEAFARTSCSTLLAQGHPPERILALLGSVPPFAGRKRVLQEALTLMPHRRSS